MALTTIKRPIGRRFAAIIKTATVDNSFNYARFTDLSGHGLTTGDFIMIENSPVPAYNGIWYADVNDENEYFIKISATSDYVSWVADATVNVRGEDLEHMWSCVQLPIVYEVINDLYPNNSASARSIVSIDNDNGYARLRLSSSLTIYPLEFIRVTSATSPELNGIFQVQAVTTLNRVTIDLTYKGTYNQSGAQVRKYYSNYALIVQVFAGITDTPGAVKKPMQLAATLKFIPDSNNKVRFSISEILQSYVKMRNAVGDDIMPNNIDFLTEFYLTYQETYDYSFGYTLLRSEGSVTNDNPDYIGKAVNAKLSFGNPYSGYLSDYLMNTSTAKFLTLFAIPVLFACQDNGIHCYQDISFINPYGGGFIQKKFYKSGVLQTTVNDTIPEKGTGVYRLPLNAGVINICSYDEVELQLTSSEAPDFVLQSGNQKDFNAGSAWTSEFFGDQSIINYTGGNPYTDIIYSDISSIHPGVYVFNYDFSNVNVSGTNASFYVVGIDPYGNIAFNNLIITLLQDSNITGQFTVEISSPVYIGVRAQASGSVSNTTVYITAFNIDSASIKSSETKKIKIDCGCSNQEIKLTWVNNLGGFDYWTFKAEKDYITEVTNTQESTKNVLPGWPQSYGHTADTLRYETMRQSRRQYIVRSQNGLTLDEAFAIAYIKSSPLVQIMEGTTRRTVTVDTGSLRITGDGDKLREIEFTITETGDIPAQNA